MADGHGGYRRPAHPAAVSGEGKLAKRTDGRPSDNPKQAKLYLQGDGSYGDSKDLNEVAAGAPLSAAGVSVPAVVPFDAPTQRPDEPVSAGADWGDGPGLADVLAKANGGLLPDDGQFAPGDVAAAAIRAAYEQMPSPGLRLLLEKLQAEGR